MGACGHAVRATLHAVDPRHRGAGDVRLQSCALVALCANRLSHLLHHRDEWRHSSSVAAAVRWADWEHRGRVLLYTAHLVSLHTELRPSVSSCCTSRLSPVNHSLCGACTPFAKLPGLRQTITSRVRVSWTLSGIEVLGPALSMPGIAPGLLVLRSQCSETSSPLFASWRRRGEPEEGHHPRQGECRGRGVSGAVGPTAEGRHDRQTKRCASACCSVCVNVSCAQRSSTQDVSATVSLRVMIMMTLALAC
jgi:hypothetical protein